MPERSDDDAGCASPLSAQYPHPPARIDHGLLADPSHSGRPGDGDAGAGGHAGGQTGAPARAGVDRPLVIQYFVWLGRVVRGDLGRSLVDRTSVLDQIRLRLPATIELAIGAFLIALLIAIPAGVLSATRRGSAVDHASTVLALGGLSLPSFWLAMLLIIVFAVKLQWLPASGYVPFFENPRANLTAMILPMFASGIRESAFLMRMLRSSMLEVLHADYVRTARAKGLRERAVVMRHALRNGLVPVVTSSGLVIAGLLGGLVITESIFSIPGFGRLIVDAIFQRDFITVQGAILVSAVLVVLVNLVVDLLVVLIDRR